MTLNESQLRSLLGDVLLPDGSGTLESSGAIQALEVTKKGCRVELLLPLVDPKARLDVETRCRELLKTNGVTVDMVVRFGAHKVPVPERKPIPGVSNLVAVASGKGGVGKSTISANLAVALSKLGARVGLLDADIYGPNVGVMFGVDAPPQVNDAQKIIPFEAHGIRLISMGMLVKQGQPVIWRGPMTHKVIQQFLFQVEWGELDYLVLDLPPGTGDIQLTLTQETPLSGAVLVTTPQKVATADARKGYEMFKEVGVPVLGIIENMSWYRCGKCDKKHELFGSGGAQRLAQELKCDLLAQLPLDPTIPSDLGKGVPYVTRFPESELAKTMSQLAVKLGSKLHALSLQRKQSGTFFPMEV